MKSIISALLAALFSLSTPAATPPSTFTVTDEDRGLYRMHPELVKEQS